MFPVMYISQLLHCYWTHVHCEGIQSLLSTKNVRFHNLVHFKNHQVLIPMCWRLNLHDRINKWQRLFDRCVVKKMSEAIKYIQMSFYFLFYIPWNTHFNVYFLMLIYFEYWQIPMALTMCINQKSNYSCNYIVGYSGKYSTTVGRKT